MYTICTILVFKIAKHAISTLAPRRKKRINRRKAKGGHSEKYEEKMLVNMFLSFRGGGIQGKICLLPLCVDESKLINAEQKVGNIFP